MLLPYDVFVETYRIHNITLWVPAAAVDTYKAVAVWKEFKDIVAIEGI
jgi:hypothetical protein